MRATTWTCAAVLFAISGSLGTAARADEGDDPSSAPLARFFTARQSAGFDPASWVTSRQDEVTVFAGLARVDVTLSVTNRATNGLEWRRLIDVDPKADLIGAVYTRADRRTTAAQTLSSQDVERLYGRLTAPDYGRDPLRVDRPSDGVLDVRIFPVAPDAPVKLVLSFVTPLSGRGDTLLYRDPLGVRPGPADEERGGEPAITPGTTLISLAVPTARVSAASVLLHLRDMVPAAMPKVASMIPGPNGLLLVPEEGEDLPPIELKAMKGAPAATSIASGGYPLFTSAFVWRVDPALVAEEMGVHDRGGVTLRFRSVDGSSSRIAPEILDASAEPTVVMGRTYTAEKFHVHVEAVDRAGTIVGKVDAVVAAHEGKPTESLSDAVRAYHRARLAERVRRWAGTDEKRIAKALAYAVDLGVVGHGVSAIAIPKDERVALPRKDVNLYLTDGAPFDGDSTAGDFKPAPPGSVR